MTAPSITIADLEGDPHAVLHRLRTTSPVAWVGSLEAWLVTGHELSRLVMLDPETFTVDDPRFSTQRVIGPSMLSLDRAEHRRHRDPFGGPFRSARIADLSDFTGQAAAELLAGVVARGSGDLRAEVAAPLAVAVMTEILDLRNVEVSDVVSWYEDIVDAVHAVTAGDPVPESGLAAFHELEGAVAASLRASRLLRSVEDAGSLSVDEIASNVGVLLFGGIVTSESSAAIAFRYLLDDPDVWERLAGDRSLVRPFVEETFRLEPSASAVDRYATRDVDLAGAPISEGDLVRVSISAANRDPAVFPDPDDFSLDRENAAKHVTFARGPHACLGIHLARLETVAAVNAVLDQTRPVPMAPLSPIEGLVFRVPETVEVTFT